jgi:hypothetical protein
MTLATPDSNNDVRLDPHGSGFSRFLTASGDGVNVSSTGLIMNGALVGSAFNTGFPGEVVADANLTGSNGLGLLGQLKQNYNTAWASGSSLPNFITAYGDAHADGTTSTQGLRAWGGITGANNSTTVIGVAGTSANMGSGTMLTSIGVYGLPRVMDSGTSTTGVGVAAGARFRSSGNMGQFIGFYVVEPSYTSTGRITGDIYGLFMPDMNSTNSADEIYGVDIRDQTKGTGIAASLRGRINASTGKYNLYLDGTAQNLLAGVTTISDTTQTTSSTTGALVVAGGIGSAKSIYSHTGYLTDRTITAGGTTGDQVINKPQGTVNFAAGATAITVTNSLVGTSSVVFAVVRTNDSTVTIKNVVPGAGSFVINLAAAATAETSVGFMVFN